MNVPVPPGEDDALKWAWREQKEWSQAAGDRKKSLFRIRTTALCLIIIAAFAATLVAPAAAMSSAAGMVFAWVAAAASATVAVLQTRIKPDQVKAWTRTRSVSEAFKAEIYTFLAGISPYRDADKVTRFIANLKAILDKIQDLEREPVQVAPPDNIRPVTDVPSYITARVDEQIERYYRPNAVKNGQRARQFRALEFGLAISAAVVSATVGSVPNLHAVATAVPVLTTIAAVVAAELAFRRYDTLALEYDRTADQLEMLKIDRSVKANAGSPQAADDDFVHACELAISIQNEAWMARRLQADTSLPRAEGDNPK